MSVPEIPEPLRGLPLPAVLLPYQHRILKATVARPVTVIEKSRRIGATWGVAADAVLTAGSAKAAGGMDVFYIGYEKEMTREFIDTCAMWARAFVPATEDVGETLIKDGDKDIQAFRIRFASGFDIVALSSRPRGLRGRQGYVIIDEAAFHDELSELLKSALALLMWGGKVLVISTHDGDLNPFNALVGDVRAGRKPYGLLHIDFDDALKDGLYRRICLAGKREWSAEGERGWRQEIIAFYGDGADEELFCVPAQGSGAFLPAVLIEARMDADIPVIRWSQPDSFMHLPEHIRQAEASEFCEAELTPVLMALPPELMCFFGQDFGRSGDLSVIWPLVQEQRMRRRPPFVLELRNIPFEQQRQILFHIVDHLPRFMGGAMDATGNGAYLAEVAAQRYGANRIAQIKLSVEWYRENMPPWKAAFEDDGLALPKDADILSDHRAVKMTHGVAQVPRDGRKAGKSGGTRHGDSAIAHALAHFASRMPTMEYGYQSAATAEAAANPHHDDDPDEAGDGRARFGAGAW